MSKVASGVPSVWSLLGFSLFLSLTFRQLSIQMDFKSFCVLDPIELGN